VWFQEQSLLGMLNYEYRHRYAEIQRQLDWLLCPDKPVRDFINSCATDVSMGQHCTVATAEEILRQMENYPHRMLYYDRLHEASQDPERARQLIAKHVRAIDPARKAELQEFADSYPIRHNTRLLIMYMPFSRPHDTSAIPQESSEAEHIAMEVRNYFLKEIWPQNRTPEEVDMLIPLSPREVGCLERAVTMKKYMSHPNNAPRKSEKNHRTVVWVFLLSCGPAKANK
jgi:hypothetical protein